MTRCQKVNDGNLTMFERLSSLIGNEKCEELDKQLKTSILKHLESMESEFKHYFTEQKE